MMSIILIWSARSNQIIVLKEFKVFLLQEIVVTLDKEACQQKMGFLCHSNRKLSMGDLANSELRPSSLLDQLKPNLYQITFKSE